MKNDFVYVVSKKRQQINFSLVVIQSNGNDV